MNKDCHNATRPFELACGAAVGAEAALLAADILFGEGLLKSWKVKAAVGAIAVGTGLAAGFLINKWCNGKPDHLVRLTDRQKQRYREVKNVLSGNELGKLR